MAQSPEYPDLKWVTPKSWTDANRTSVQLVVIHTTEGSAHAQSAEDGATYDARRTDGTSTHYFHDSDSTVQCVRTNDRAHTARTQGNKRGIHHELCTRAGSAKWNDVYHQAMLRRAARQAARDAKKWGIPVRHLTVAQVAAGEKGFCGHYDITRAFPQDNGTHTDPGSNFPWSQFLDLVRAELNGEDDVTKADFTSWMTEWAKSSAGKAALGAAVLDAKVGGTAVPARTVKQALGDLANGLRPALWFPATNNEAKEAKLPANSPLAALLALPGAVKSLADNVGQLKAGLTATPSNTEDK